MLCFSFEIVLPAPRKPFSQDKAINPVISERLFKDQIAPIVMRIFFVRDFHIRMVLLR